MIDGWLQESSHQGGDPHAIATRDGSPLGSLRSTVLRPRLGPRADPGHRGHPRHRQTHGHLRLAHHGIEPRRTLYQLPSRPQSRRLVPLRRQPHPARPDRQDPRAGGLAHRPGGRRHRRAAPRPQDQGQGLLPRCRPVLAQGGGQVLRTEVGRDDGPRPTPLEQARQGVALPDRLGLARIGATTAAHEDVDRLREADGPPGPPLVPPAACRAGARWRVRGREAGPRLSPPWGDDDLSPATRCGVVRSSGRATHQQARSQAQEGPRQVKLQEWTRREDTPWEDREVEWYGGERKQMRLFSRTGLWYTAGQDPVAIRYLLLRDPEGALEDAGYLCTEEDAPRGDHDAMWSGVGASR